MPNYPMQYQQMPAPYVPAYASAAWQPQQYAPSYAQQASPQFMPPQQPRQPQSGLNWCQGIEGAKGFYVAPGTSELIMDSEGPTFYIKAVDNTGIPAPLRIFHYSEEIAAQASAPAQTDYITRQELPALLAQLLAQQNGGNTDA